VPENPSILIFEFFYVVTISHDNDILGYQNSQKTGLFYPIFKDYLLC